MQQAQAKLLAQPTKDIENKGKIQNDDRKKIICARLAREFTATTPDQIDEQEPMSEARSIYRWLMGDEKTPKRTVAELIQGTTR